MTKPRQLAVTLLSAPQYPLETLFLIWEQSRRDSEDWPSPSKIHTLLTNNADGKYDTARRLGFEQSDAGVFEAVKHVLTTIQMLFNDDVPVLENIYFTFCLDNAPISLREQLVRSRIGTHIPGAPSPDYVYMPDNPSSKEDSYWSQTARVVPWNKFYSNGRFILPEFLASKKTGMQTLFENGIQDETAETIYLGTLKHIQESYEKLIQLGVPLEDARNLIPLGATHSITWTLSAKSMKHIFGKRSCWIAQPNLWEEVMTLMIECLCRDVSIAFSVFTKPICYKGDKFVGCKVPGTVRDRILGADGDQPICPLYVKYHTEEAFKIQKDNYEAGGQVSGKGWYNASFPYDDPSNIETWYSEDKVSMSLLKANSKRFSRLWQMPLLPESVAQE